jgi:cytidylate kinase
MPVITISREFGSEGDLIAHHVAQSLNYPFVDQKFIGDILGQYGYVEFDKEFTTLPTFWERFDAQRERQRDLMSGLLNQVIQAVAHHGNVVILGRVGFEVLGGFSDVLHVRLQAPLPVRVGRIMEQQALTFEEAVSVVRQSDKVRVAFVEEFYKVPWDSIHAFDMVINTGKISPDLAASWIIDATKSPTTNFEIDRQVTASIVVDHILEKAVSEELRCTQMHR